MRKLFFLACLAFFLARPASATNCTAGVNTATAAFGMTATSCIYVDYATGSDSSYDGTTETISGSHGPFKHAPGMLGLTPSGSGTGDGCTSNCSSATTGAGVAVILKGGTIWPYTTVPWQYTASGTGTGSTFGCTGNSCTYLGYDPTWNQGKVNSVALTRDLGGCATSGAPTVAFSGGGGSGAAATAYVSPSTVDARIAGFVYKVLITNQGSGYTSNPAVTISGDGCTLVTGVADIYRPVIDLGAGSSIAWPSGQNSSFPNTFSPGLSAGMNYGIIDHLEVRNLLSQARATGGSNDAVIGMIVVGFQAHGSNTVSNNFLHGSSSDCVLSSCGLVSTQEGADSAIFVGDGNDEISYNTITNGDAAIIATGADACGGGNLCEHSEFDIHSAPGTAQQGGEIQHNHEYGISWLNHWGGTATTLPFVEHDNEMWLVLPDVNPTGHVNEMYLLYTNGSTLYVYNNIWHNAVGGASNQQQLGAGTTQYFFNNISWGIGDGTSNYGMDQDGMDGTAVHMYFYNNTMYGRSGTVDCLDDNATTFASALTVVLQNNHCITAANPYYGKGAAGSTYKNFAGSTLQANIEAASAVQSTSTSVGQGYTQADLYAPVSSDASTTTFASTPSSANLTSLCSGYLTALCADILGNPRPSTGGWQAGAYFSGSGGSSSVAPPTNLTAIVQ